MAINNLTPDQWKLAAQARSPQVWAAGLPDTVGKSVEESRLDAERQYDNAPVDIARKLTADTPIDINQDISGQLAGIESTAYGAARGAREALGTRANALRSILKMAPHQETGKDNSSTQVRNIESAVNEQATASHPNAIAKQRAKLRQQGGI